jgi:hypothetical protein
VIDGSYCKPRHELLRFMLRRLTILNQRYGTMPCPLRWEVHRLTR